MPETRLGRECAKIAMLRNCVYGSSHTGKNKLLLRNGACSVTATKKASQ